jgi:hypothetical protein
MERTRVLSCIIVLIMAAGLFSGCATGPSEEELAKAEAEAKLVPIREANQKLQQQRADLAAAEQQLAEIEAIPERKRSDEQKTLAAELPAQIEQLKADRDLNYEQLQTLLAEFLTVALNDFPESPETVECLQIYSDEAILVARDMVAKAGDYAKASDHLAGAKGYYEAVGLPVYQPLLDTLAELEEWRYITKERFDAVTKNMTRDEVKAVAGVPYYGNIQEDSQRGVETWLYRKREGGAAAVYFKIKTGKTYGTKWDAIKTKVVDE